jgi:hypothetical protein
VTCGSTVRGPRTRLTAKEIVDRSKPAIVRIEVEGEEGTGVGTGFIVAAHGHIVTNLHVIHGAHVASVTLLDGKRYPVARVIAIDELHDLAVIAIEAQDLPTLRLGNSDAVSAGDRVFAIGNPQGFDYTVSDGLISSVRQLDPTLTVLQISAPISQGSSGGPLFNLYGEVIGVATLLYKDGQNLNFGMPSNYVHPLLERLGGGESFRGFVARTQVGKAQQSGPAPRVQRQVPHHDTAYLDGCTDQELMSVAHELVGAIEKGAPLYNAGDHEACFRIYEGVSLRLERAMPASCHGPRDGLGQGLLRAGTMEDHGLKAWAMRDAFDGLLDVIMRRLNP